MRNYYDILGVSRDATQEEIKNAYRKLAKKYHPDSSGSQNDKDRFQEIQEAYSVLSNPEKRKMYHYYGHAAYRNNYHAQHASDSSGCGHDGCGGCGDNCDGSCGGHGHTHPHPAEEEKELFKHVVRIAVWLEMEETFQEVIKDAVLKEWKFQVKIPAGTFEKQILNLEDVIYENTELIEHLHDRYPDNLYVVIILLKDKPGYTRHSYHLCMDYTVDYHTLVLGGTIKIKSLTGNLSVELPPGTSPGRKFRISGQGLNYPPKIGKRGDLYLNLHIRIPTHLTDAQRIALQMLRDAFEPEDKAVEL